MVVYLGFDVGGSSIKYALIDEEGTFLQKGHFQTPDNLDSFYAGLKQAKESLPASQEIAGACFSLPGAVDEASGVIGGSSALDYIHAFDIRSGLEKALQLPVSMENDANCAALGEIWVGAGRGHRDAAFLVIGTGVGGALVHDRKIIHGPHLHGGEFGYMIMTPEYEILSDVGSTGGLVRRLAKIKEIPETDLDGLKVFALSEQGDADAKRVIDEMYEYLARAIYDIQYIYDPEIFLLGGAISTREDFIPCIETHLQHILQQVGVAHVTPKLCGCEHGNDANLLGAVFNFKKKNPGITKNGLSI